MTPRNCGIDPHIEAFNSKNIAQNLENHVFVVTKHAAGSGKMLVEVNIATAPTHIDNEQIINAICDSGMTYFPIYDFDRFYYEGLTKFVLNSSRKLVIIKDLL